MKSYIIIGIPRYMKMYIKLHEGGVLGLFPLHQGSFFPPQAGGEAKNNFPPRGSDFGGEVKISPPGVRILGGK